MDIEFDSAKNAANIAKHGVSLADAVRMDLATAAVVLDNRKSYGESRYRAFGWIDGLGYCLVFTFRGAVVRIISFRRAHDDEMKLFRP